MTPEQLEAMQQPDEQKRGGADEINGMAEVMAVSYTHLDVYKRQHLIRPVESSRTESLMEDRFMSGLVRRLPSGELTAWVMSTAISLSLIHILISISLKMSSRRANLSL